MVNKLVLSATVMVIGIAAAGCGGSSGGSSSTSADTNEAKLEKYAQCMRSHGVPSFPDPVNGQLSPTVTKGGALDPSNPQLKSAQQTCRSLAPGGKTPGSSPSTQQQSQLLKFASCMRSHGVRKFPDPTGGHSLIGGVDPNTPQFQSALQACQSLIPGGITGGVQ